MWFLFKLADREVNLCSKSYRLTAEHKTRYILEKKISAYMAIQNHGLTAETVNHLEIVKFSLRNCREQEMASTACRFMVLALHMHVAAHPPRG